MIRWLPALITYTVIGLALYCHKARADDCTDFAVLVEVLIEQQDKESTRDAWMRQVRGDMQKTQLVTRAYQFVADGGSEGQAWQQCESY